MRLWPLAILAQLPRQQLLGQHRECCALRGKGWGRKHSTVDYVFREPYYFLYRYHIEIMKEMSRREYKVSPEWMSPHYRGKTIGFDYSLDVIARPVCAFCIYPEHNWEYVDECIANLARKGVEIHSRKTAQDMRMRGHELHRWLFCNKDGQDVVFSHKHMPFSVFKKDAVWGGTCEIGGIRCRIRIRHNSGGEKGKRLEVQFPDEELDKVVPFEKSTLVGHIEIRGSFREGTGKCVFRWIDGIARAKEQQDDNNKRVD